MAMVPHSVEIFPKISIACVECTNVTDRRQTDGRPMTNSERELEFTFAKNAQNDILQSKEIWTVFLLWKCTHLTETRTERNFMDKRCLQFTFH